MSDPEARARQTILHLFLGYGLTFEEIEPHLDMAVGWLPFRSTARGFRWLDDLDIPPDDARFLMQAAQWLWATGPYDERPTAQR